MPIFTQSAPMSPSTTSICWAMNRRHIVNGEHAPRVLRGQRGDRRRRIAAERGHRLDVGLDAGAAAGVRPGDDQNAARRRRASGRGGTNDAADIVDDDPDQRLVLALRHHPDHRLGPGLADEHAAVVAEPSASSSIASLTLGCSSGWPPLNRTLRSSCGSGSNTRQTWLVGVPALRTTASTCRAAIKSVARGRVIAEDDVPGLLAADVEAVAAHVLDDVAVADLGALQGQADAGEVALSPMLDITVATTPPIFSWPLVRH